MPMHYWFRLSARIQIAYGLTVIVPSISNENGGGLCAAGHFDDKSVPEVAGITIGGWHASERAAY
jgi:hypothetical protein